MRPSVLYLHERHSTGCRLKNGRHACAVLCHLTVTFIFKSVTEGADLRVMVRDENIQLGSYKD